LKAFFPSDKTQKKTGRQLEVEGRQPVKQTIKIERNIWGDAVDLGGNFSQKMLPALRLRKVVLPYVNC